MDEETLSLAISATEAEIEAEEQAWFVPHAVWVPERDGPTQIGLLAVCGGNDKLLLLFEEGSDPDTFLPQTLAGMPETILFMGRVVGFGRSRPPLGLWSLSSKSP